MPQKLAGMRTEPPVSEPAAKHAWAVERLLGPGSLRVVPTEAPGPRPPWAHLVDAAAQYPVTVNRCLIGRSAAADLSLPADTVSRRHALLWQEDGATWIYDLGSANGTYVNGMAAAEPLAIEPGQRITLGAVPYVVNPA